MMTPSSDSQCPALDREKAISICGGDEDLFFEMAGMFADEISERWDRLKSALAAGVALNVEEQAHTIKGMCANLAAAPLMETAHRIELAGRNKDLDRAVSMQAVFEAEFQRLRDHLEKIIPQPPG